MTKLQTRSFFDVLLFLLEDIVNERSTGGYLDRRTISVGTHQGREAHQYREQLSEIDYLTSFLQRHSQVLDSEFLRFVEDENKKTLEIRLYILQIKRTTFLVYLTITFHLQDCDVSLSFSGATGSEGQFVKHR